MMMSRSLLVPLAFLCTAIDAQDVSPKVKGAIVIYDSSAVPNYTPSSSLYDVFQSSVTLYIENTDDADMTVAYKVFVNNQCQESNAQLIQSEQTLSVGAGSMADVDLSPIETLSDSLPCGPACLFVTLTAAGKEDGMARAGMVSQCENLEVDLALSSVIDSSAECQVNLGEKLIDQPCLSGLQDLTMTNLGPDAMPMLSSDFSPSVLVFIRKSYISDEDIRSKMRGDDCYWDYNYGNSGPWGDWGYSGSWGDWGNSGSWGDWGNSGSWGDWGNSGSWGDWGNSGSWGDWGNSGSWGDWGATGTKGDSGNWGNSGSWGDWGATGTKGDSGNWGDSGPKGDSGTWGDSGPTGSSGPSGRRRKRSAEGAQESMSRQKRSHNMEMIMQWYHEWSDQRERMGMMDMQLKNCTSKSFMYGERDIPLVGGDIVFPHDVPLAKDGSHAVSLDDVMLEPATKMSLCTYDTMGMNGMHHAQLVMVADPLSMNDDNNLCNNAIMLNISYDCSDYYSDYDQGQCEVIVDPLARGHRAAFVFNGAPSLLYEDGSLQYMSSESNGGCMSLEYYTTLSSMARFGVIERRYQKEADADATVCLMLEAAERSEERAMFRDIKPEPVERKKRAIDGDGAAINKDALTEAFMQIVNTYSEVINWGNYYEGMGMWCNLTVLSNKYRKIFDGVEADDPLHEAYEAGKGAADELSSAFSFYGQEMCPDSDKPSPDDWQGDPSGDGTKDDALDDALGDIRHEDERSEEARRGSADEKLDYLDESVEEAKRVCPGRRGRSRSASQDKTKQYADMLRMVSSVKSDEMEVRPLSESSCGQRMLQQALKNGVGQLINKDIRPLQRPKTKYDEEVEMVTFLRHVSDVVREKEETMSYEDIDIEDVRHDVFQRMNDSAREEAERCDMDKDEQLAQYYRADNTYPVHWEVRDGKIFQGIADGYSSDFGKDEVGPERMMLWKQMAVCACSHCSYEQTVYPDWSDNYNYYYNYDYYGDSGPGTDRPDDYYYTPMK